MATAGFDCELTLGSDIVGLAQNVDPTLEADEQDISRRDTAPWDDWQQGRKRLTADIECLYLATAGAVVAMVDAWFNDGDLNFQMADENGNGYSGTLGVLSINPGPRNMDDAVTLSTSVKSRGSVSQVGGS